jgi:hypothetical protein
VKLDLVLQSSSALMLEEQVLQQKQKEIDELQKQSNYEND